MNSRQWALQKCAFLVHFLHDTVSIWCAKPREIGNFWTLYTSCTNAAQVLVIDALELAVVNLNSINLTYENNYNVQVYAYK